MKNKKSVIITGANGMLGEAVCRQFSSSWKVHAVGKDVDVRDKLGLQRFIDKAKPSAVIHLAALTDLEYCERNPVEAYEVNALSVAYVLESVKKFHVPLVIISTARIFDGKRKGYDEDDVANPQGIYGKSKYAGEVIARAYPKSIVIRAGWMVGGGPNKDKKFINKIIQRINSGAEELQIVNDKHGSISYTYDVAKIIEYLLTRRAYGIYHCVCDGGASRFEIAKFVVKKLGLDKKIKVIPVSSRSWDKEYFSPRPGFEQLNNNILKKMNPDLTRHWRVCLQDYLAKFDWLAK